MKADVIITNKIQSELSIFSQLPIKYQETSVYGVENKKNK